MAYMRHYTRDDARAAGEDYDDEIAAAAVRALTPVANMPHADERGIWPPFVEPTDDLG